MQPGRWVRPHSPFSHGHLTNDTAAYTSGTVLAWGRGITEFSAVIMIAYYPMVISTLIYNRFMTGGLKESSAVAFTMIVACLLIFGVLRFISGRIGGKYDRV